jgi:hypothetical protein
MIIFRLINPTKSELGMVSKKMLDKIIETVKSKSHLLQWKNSDSVIQWFSSLQNKQRLHFIQFDVINFYASISPDLLENSLTFAARYIPISEEDKQTSRIFLGACRRNLSLLKSPAKRVIFVHECCPFCACSGAFTIAKICIVVPMFAAHTLFLDHYVFPNIYC